MFKVYRIENQHLSDNSYFIDRSEYWICKLDNIFDSEDNAKEYILENNKKFSDMILMGFHIKDDNKRIEFYNKFCFDDEYQYIRKYFLGKPNIDIIKKQLTANGIKFIKE